jgi:hypothetical protein
MAFILLGRGPVVRDTGLSSPVYLHLRANRDEELFAGIAAVGILLTQDVRGPRLRFGSRPGLATFSGRMQQESDAETYCGSLCPLRTAPSDSGSTVHAGVTVTSYRGSF